MDKTTKKTRGLKSHWDESTLALALVIPGLPSCYDTMIGRIFDNPTDLSFNGNRSNQSSHITTISRTIYRD